MAFTLTDSTAALQRFAVDNTQNTELGSGTPSSELSVQGQPVISGSMLAAKVATPGSMVRITGSVSVGTGSTSTVSTATVGGFGSISGTGQLVNFASAKNAFTAMNTGSASATLGYGVF